MFFVRKLNTGTVHIVLNLNSYKTICGKTIKSNVVNEDVKLGFTRPKSLDEVLNKPKINCKTCLKIYKNMN